MYEFAITMLLGLALVTVVNLASEHVPSVDRFRTAVTILLAVAGAYALDFSLFAGFGVDLREAWMGPAMTGLIVAGSTTVWQAVLAWLGYEQPSRSETTTRQRPRIAA
ncbi:MAG: hypothetical protein KY395_05940 [Actinobacteria bacterium]|nr:hypothetical protein [Actinomycetota bacterium]